MEGLTVGQRYLWSVLFVSSSLEQQNVHISLLFLGRSVLNQLRVTFKSSEFKFFSFLFQCNSSPLWATQWNSLQTQEDSSLLPGSSDKDLIRSKLSSWKHGFFYAALLQAVECFFNSCQLLTVTWSHYHNQTSWGHISHASAPQPSSFPLVIVIVGVTRFVITFFCNEDSRDTKKLLYWLCRPVFKGFRSKIMNDHMTFRLFFLM